MTSKSGNKRILIIVFSFILILAVSYLVISHLFSTNKALEKKMQESAAMLTSESPIQVDRETRLDSVVAIRDEKLKYYYTLVNYTEAEINRDTVSKYIRPGIIENVKRSPDLELLRQNEVSFDYIYSDRKGVYVLTIEITPDIYTEN